MIMIQNIEITTVFEANYDAIFNGTKRHIENIGGSRSSKSWSIAQLIVIYCCSHDNKKIDVVRKTLRSLSRSFKKDLEGVIGQMKLWKKIDHNKTNNTYTFPTGSVIELIGADDADKLRGTKRDILIIDECNELFNDDYLQLSIRTSDKIVMMYNPSHEREWMKHIPIADKTIIHSTYRDNPFLTKAQENEIERLKDKDYNEYLVYCLGQKAQSRKNVYTNWEFVDKKPPQFKNYVYGLDFGWVVPSALIRVWYNEDEIYLEEVLYEPHIQTYEMPQEFIRLGIEKDVEILCDYASPQYIDELQKAGFYAINADKSVKKGISAFRNFKVYVDSKAQNIKNEYENYQYKVVNDIITEEPVKYNDHILDGGRYACLYIYDNLRFGSPVQFGF